MPESAISTRRLIRVTGRGAARSIRSSGSTFGALAPVESRTGGSGIDGSSGRDGVISGPHGPECGVG